jgi:endoglucanase
MRSAALFTVIALLWLSVTGCRAPDVDRHRTAEAAARRAAEDFFDRYVDQTGRVVRKDQGGDTVSEGQAYALLLAVALNDRARFDLVWWWTRDNLQRRDRLFSWHWDSGVTDDNSASDADLDIARALILAGRRFNESGLARAGTDVGKQLLERETRVVAGQRILLPGQWAADQQPPIEVNPSYVSPVATQVLWRASKDARWRELERGSRALLRRLANARMPPDWVTVEADGSVGPASSRPSSGWDAVRIPLRQAESCVPADRRIAASLAGHLGHDRTRSAVSWMAEAAAQSAAGDPGKAGEAMVRAARVRKTHASYYGDAWEALGRYLLLDDRLGGCAP